MFNKHSTFSPHKLLSKVLPVLIYSFIPYKYFSALTTKHGPCEEAREAKHNKRPLSASNLKFNEKSKHTNMKSYILTQVLNSTGKEQYCKD